MNEKIQKSIEKAKEVVEGMKLEEPYKSLTYSKLLEKFLMEEDTLIKHPNVSQAGQISFVQLVNKIKPKNNHEKVISIGYHLIKNEGRNFSYEDIDKFYMKVAWKRHVNPSELIRQLKQKGFVEESENKETGKKEFRILEDSINLVEERLE
ncbi:MAG: hypothetical protein HYW24_02290 [Candidatus Aenigmarchaeota archaeon]|nr:hypothetical protein [Candidatus Aenigmarchaeota archaeon]